MPSLNNERHHISGWHRYTLEMPAIFEIQSAAVQQAIEETILWCTHRQLTMAPLPQERIQQRLKLMDQASELMRQGIVEEGPVFDLLKIERNQLYQGGRALLLEAEQTLPVSVAQLFRSADLQPPPFDNISIKDLKDAVGSLVKRRASLISKLGYKQNACTTGRLLLYWPEDNLADGAAEYASLGFFDANNIPPWDTWVAFSDKILLSWVPAELIELVQKGIEANPENCIAWLA